MQRPHSYNIDLNDFSDGVDFDLIFDALSKHKVARIQATTKDAYTTDSYIV